MKHLTGYLTALIIGAITWMLGQLASRYSALMDMIYPYVTRTIQEGLAQWSSEVNFCLWQMFLLLMILGVVAALVMVVLGLAMKKWKWLGDYALPISLVLGMISAIPITALLS